MSAIGRVGAVATVSLLTLTAVAPSAMAEDVPLDGVTNLTGVAWNPTSGQLFLLDDSGITVAGSTGQRIGTVDVPAEVVSAQALAVQGEYLYIGDVGDPNRSRDSVTVYRYPAMADATGYRAYDFSYPDGAADAKAVMVSGRSRIYVITDGDQPGLYRAKLDPSRTEVNALSRVGDAPAGVTDASFLPDGVTIVARTSDGVALIDANTGSVTRTTTYVDAPVDESITAFGGRMLVGSSSGLRDEELPSGATITPTAAPSASSSAQPSASPSVVASATDGVEVVEDTKGSARRGTIIAILAALALSLTAGAVAFIARD